MSVQKTLSNEQIRAFGHDDFVEDQTRHFISLVGAIPGGSNGKVIADVGGGCGFFAKRLRYLSGHTVRVIDLDAASVEACERIGVEAIQGDALNPPVVGDEDIVSFNLILHHLIGASERLTLDLQRKALAAWRPHVRAVFVHEYIYESYFGNLSGRLIYEITKNPILSWIGRGVAAVVPSLMANTFGVGVRFRSHLEWVRVFESAGYDAVSSVTGNEEYVSPPLRLLLIKTIRRDSYLLLPRTG